MLSVNLDFGGGHVVVTLCGELDFADSAGVAALLGTTAAREPRIIVDLSGLEFIDASGVRALAGGRRHARSVGGDLLLAAPQWQVQQILPLVWEPSDPGIYPSVAAAATELPAAGRGGPAAAPQDALRAEG